MRPAGELAVGLMSGTSADGITAALARIGPGRRVRVVAHRTTAFPPARQREILALSDAPASRISEANFRLGRLFARAARDLLRAARVPAGRVRVIGSHGQTIHHSSGRHTLQIGEPSIIAEETGIDVVADFRPRDIAAGGNGAPLVPFFDEFVFGISRWPRVLLNLGGIANLTLVGGGRRPIAMDTGPGNALMDEAVRLGTGGRESFDRDGLRARRGRLDPALLERMMDEPYFRKRPPKSTGRETFGRAFLLRHAARDLRRRPDDVLATLAFLTARTVTDAMRAFLPVEPMEVIVSGGGALNRTVMDHLEWMAFPAAVRPSSVYGIDPMAKEAAAFALLAHRAIRGAANTLPGTTGASRAVCAGKILRGRGA